MDSTSKSDKTPSSPKDSGENIEQQTQLSVSQRVTNIPELLQGIALHLLRDSLTPNARGNNLTNFMRTCRNFKNAAEETIKNHALPEIVAHIPGWHRYDSFSRMPKSLIEDLQKDRKNHVESGRWENKTQHELVKFATFDWARRYDGIKMMSKNDKRTLHRYNFYNPSQGEPQNPTIRSPKDLKGVKPENWPRMTTFEIPVPYFKNDQEKWQHIKDTVGGIFPDPLERALAIAHVTKYSNSDIRTMRSDDVKKAKGGGGARNLILTEEMKIYNDAVGRIRAVPNVPEELARDISMKKPTPAILINALKQNVAASERKLRKRSSSKGSQGQSLLKEQLVAMGSIKDVVNKAEEKIKITEAKRLAAAYGIGHQGNDQEWMAFSNENDRDLRSLLDGTTGSLLKGVSNILLSSLKLRGDALKTFAKVMRDDDASEAYRELLRFVGGNYEAIQPEVLKINSRDLDLCDLPAFQSLSMGSNFLTFERDPKRKDVAIVRDDEGKRIADLNISKNSSDDLGKYIAAKLPAHEDYFKTMERFMPHDSASLSQEVNRNNLIAALVNHPVYGRLEYEAISLLAEFPEIEQAGRDEYVTTALELRLGIIDDEVEFLRRNVASDVDPQTREVREALLHYFARDRIQDGNVNRSVGPLSLPPNISQERYELLENIYENAYANHSKLILGKGAYQQYASVGNMAGMDLAKSHIENCENNINNLWKNAGEDPLQRQVLDESRKQADINQLQELSRILNVPTISPIPLSSQTAAEQSKSMKRTHSAASTSSHSSQQPPIKQTAGTPITPSSGQGIFPQTSQGQNIPSMHSQSYIPPNTLMYNARAFQLAPIFPGPIDGYLFRQDQNNFSFRSYAVNGQPILIHDIDSNSISSLNGVDMRSVHQGSMVYTSLSITGTGYQVRPLPRAPNRQVDKTPQPPHQR